MNEEGVSASTRRALVTAPAMPSVAGVSTISAP
jgi:hypothetical protein